MTIISVTERQSFKRCRRQWDLSSKYRQNLTKIMPNSAFNLGSMIHSALESWMLHNSNELVVCFEAAASKEYDSIRESYKVAIGAYPSDSELSSFFENVDLGQHMCRNYQQYYKTPLPRGWKVLAPEQEIRVSIPNTPHELEGTLDALVQDSSGVLYILEHKTASTWPKSEVMRSDDQFLAYIWMANKLGLGEVRGLLYDGLLKSKSPKSGNLGDLFKRETLVRPHQELNEFEIFLAAEANDIGSNPPLYINRPWSGCNTFPNLCDYEALCTAMSRGEDSAYIRKTLYKEATNDKVD